MNDLLPSAPAKGTTAIQRFQGTPHSVPPEVAALGQARSIHRPWPIYDLLRSNRAACLLIGLVLFLGPFLIFFTVRPTNSFPLFLCSILGTIVLGFPLFPFQTKGAPTFLCFQEALVIVESDEFTVIPWEEIPQYTIGESFVTSEGKKYILTRLFTFVSDLCTLMETVREEVQACQLPPALEAVKAGQTLNFGAFGVNAQSISYKGETLTWEMIAQMEIVNQRGHRVLSFTRAGSRFVTSALVCPLTGVPNDFVMLEVIRHICPANLLVSKSE